MILKFLILFVSLFSMHANAANSFVIQGRLLDSSNNPITTTTSFTVQIRSPGTENCLLYQESQTVDLSTTNGAFALTIGAGTRVAASVDGGNSLSTVFSNSSAISLTSASTPCANSDTSYTPASTDVRKLAISFDDGTGVDTLPVISMGWVPQSLYAQDAAKLAGIAAVQFLKVASGTTPTTLTNAQYTELMSLIGGSSSLYCKTDGANSQTYTGTATASSIVANSVTTVPVQQITGNGLTSGSLLSLQSNSTSAINGNTGLDVAISGANANSGVTRTGVSSVVSASGTGSKNIAAYFSATGGDSNVALATGVGNVGIGTTSPSYLLDVNGDINFAAGSWLRTGGTQILRRSGSNTQLRGFTGIDFIINAGSTASAVLDSSGRFGIGTTTPASRLHVATSPTATTNFGTLSVGGGPFDGSTSGYYTGAAGGASIAVNELSGYTGDLLNLQIAGVPRFRVYNTGGAVFGGSVALSGGQTINWGSNATIGGGTSYIPFSTSGSEKMRLTSDGYLGIGTTSPTNVFHVISTAAAVARLQSSASTSTIQFSDNATSTMPTIGSTGDSLRLGTNGSTRMTILSDGVTGIGTVPTLGSSILLDVNGRVRGSTFLVSGGTGAATVAYGRSSTSGVFFPTTDVIALSTASTERLRVTSAGYVGIGTATPSEMLEVAGTVKATIFDNTSDRRLKKDIHGLGLSLNQILKLRPVSYYFKNQESPRLQYGFIAQEVEQIYPSIVSTDPKSGLKAMNYSGLISPLIKAVQELYQNILTQSEEMASLKSEVDELKQQNKLLLESLCEKDPTLKACR